MSSPPKYLPTGVTKTTLIRDGRKQHDAEILQEFSEQPKSCLRIDLPLNVAVDVSNPEVVDFPFDGFWVVSTVNAADFVNLSYGANKSYNNNSQVPLKRNLAIRFDTLNLEARLSWPVQSTGFLTVIFFQGGTITPGSIDTNISGAVSLQVPTSADDTTLGSTSNSSRLAVPLGANTQLCITNNNRSAFTFTPTVGGYVTATAGIVVTGRGVYVAANQAFEWTNTAPCYFWPDAAGFVTGIEEEL